MLDSVLSARGKHEAETGRRQCLEAGAGGWGLVSLRRRLRIKIGGSEGMSHEVSEGRA